MTIEKGHAFRTQEEKICVPHEMFLEPTEEEEISKGYMMTKEEFEEIKYEDPLVKKLFQCQVRRDSIVSNYYSDQVQEQKALLIHLFRKILRHDFF